MPRAAAPPLATSITGSSPTALADRALLAAGLLIMTTVAFSSALVEVGAVLILLAGAVLAAARVLSVPPGLAAGLALYFSAASLSTVTSAEPALSARALFAKTAEYALLCAAGAHLGRMPRTGRRVLTVFAVAAIAIGADALVQGAVGRDLLRGRELVHGSRLMGPFNSPNNLASYLAMAIPVQVGLLAGAGRGWKALLLAGIGLETAVLLGSDARGVTLALILSLGVYCLAARRARLLAVGGLLGVLAVWRWGPALWSAITRLDPGRREGWSVAWGMFRDHPWVGIGWGRFMAHYEAYAPPRDFYQDPLRVEWARPQYAHNCFLQLLAEGGLLSLAAFLGLVGWVGYVALRAAARGGGPDRALAAGLISAVSAALLNMAFDTGLYSLPIATLFWLLLGLTAGLAAMERPR